jgi:hypothetical protein
MKPPILKFASIAGALCLMQPTTALEIRQPQDLNYAVEIYDGSNFVAGAVSFKDTVEGVPFYRSTTIHLKKTVKDPFIKTIDKDNDTVVQKHSPAGSINDDTLIEIINCKKTGTRKVCEIVVSPLHATNHNGLSTTDYEKKNQEIRARLDSISNDEKRRRRTQQFDDLDKLMADIEALESTAPAKQ